MSADTTFAADLTVRSDQERELLGLAERVARRLRSTAQQTRCVSIRVRYADFTAVNRSQTLTAPTDVTRQIHHVAVELLNRLNPRQPVRLLSIRLEQLVPTGSGSEQLSFDEPVDPGWRDAEAVADAVTARFGVHSVRPASLLSAPARAARTDRADRPR